MNREIKTKMKKIKSVKLKNDFRTALDFVPKGTELIITNDKHHYIVPNQLIYYSIENIENNTTDLFEIEYFPETKSITVKIEYEHTLEDEPSLTAENIANMLILCTMQIDNLKVTEVNND